MTHAPARTPASGLAALAFLVALAPFADGGEGMAATSPDVTEQDLRAHLQVLASDAMEGRATTEKGGWEASRYVAESFARSGLTPLGDGGGWFQQYVVPLPILGEGNLLEAKTPSGALSFAVEKDWNPFSATASAKVAGDLVFAGFGIRAPDVPYDDYDGLDVKGKIVLVLRKSPGLKDIEHATFVKKLSVAAERGAAALLVCNDAVTAGSDGDELYPWSVGLGPPSGSGAIPFAFVSRRVAAALLEPLGEDLEAIEKEIRASGPKSRPVPGVSVELRTAVSTTKDANARNVVGFLPGRDPDVADEVVVLGAHHDHVGKGGFGSLGGSSAAGQVHNGADDNGSGTAALLELAEWFAQSPHRPRRSLLFLSFSGEEMGLLGSLHYVEHPVLPLADAAAMLNMDMIGRCAKHRLEVGGVGTAKGLQDLVAKAAEPHGYELTWDPGGNAPSDSTSFFQKKVPVLFFFTGLHEDYHRPTDDCDKIAWSDLAGIAKLVRDVATEIAERDLRLEYTEPPRPPRPPILGISLSGEPDPSGVAVAKVLPGGPADQAGLKAGDVIVSVAGDIVRTQADLRQTLGKLKPGKTVDVVVLREGESVTIPVTLGERPGRGG
jgi:hypothetical protein